MSLEMKPAWELAMERVTPNELTAESKPIAFMEYGGRELIKIASDAPGLAIGIPVRRTSPVEFWMCMLQALMPLGVSLYYLVPKGADMEGGHLGAAARNEILATALKKNTPYVMFLDDDVCFPDVTIYRLWNQIRIRPDIACVTAVYTTKLEPSEPFLYVDDQQGAYWDWPLGTMIPIQSAGAGCMIVNMEYVKKLEPPWFNDTMSVRETESDTRIKDTWGHDRYFHNRLRLEAGGAVYADTGLLLAHFDVQRQKHYIMPPTAPCFQRPMEGESFIPFYGGDPPANNWVLWKQIVPGPSQHIPFKAYLDWLKDKQTSGLHVKLVK